MKKDVAGVGASLSTLRRMKKWSAREMGRRAGLPHASVTNFERGRHQPLSTLVKLAKAHGLNVVVYLNPK